VDDAEGYSDEHDDQFTELRRRAKVLERAVAILEEKLEIAKIEHAT
jgi:hypothetical protein